MSDLAAHPKKISIVTWVDAAHNLSLQATLRWVSAANLMGSRKGRSKFSHMGQGSLKCHINTEGLRTALAGVNRGYEMPAPFILSSQGQVSQHTCGVHD